jgi:hypothetical protein
MKFSYYKMIKGDAAPLIYFMLAIESSSWWFGKYYMLKFIIFNRAFVVGTDWKRKAKCQNWEGDQNERTNI